MPELPILDDEGKLRATALDIIVAIMTYPEDEERQEELRAAYLVERIPDVPEADQLLAKLSAEVPWLAAALRRSGAPRRVIASAKKTAASAWAVGETLLTMLGAAITPSRDSHEPGKGYDGSSQVSPRLAGRKNAGRGLVALPFRRSFLCSPAALGY
jgi:hypothetical protein